MPRYYNKTRGPLPLELPSGSTVVTAKTYIDIARDEEGCGSVVRAVRKGFLVAPAQRTEVVETVQAAPLATAEVMLPEMEEAKADPEPEVEVSDSSEEELSSLSGKSSKKTRR